MLNPTTERALIKKVLRILQAIWEVALGIGVGIRPLGDRLEIFVEVQHRLAGIVDLPRFSTTTTIDRLEADLECLIATASQELAKRLKLEWRRVLVTKDEIHSILHDLSVQALETFHLEWSRQKYLEKNYRYHRYDLSDFFAKPLAFVEVNFEVRKPRPGWVPSIIVLTLSTLAFFLLRFLAFLPVRESEYSPPPPCLLPLPPPPKTPVKITAPPARA